MGAESVNNSISQRIYNTPFASSTSVGQENSTELTKAASKLGMNTPLGIVEKAKGTMNEPVTGGRVAITTYTALTSDLNAVASLHVLKQFNTRIVGLKP